MFIFLCSETKGSIEPGACKICKILRNGSYFFREFYLLLLCRHCSKTLFFLVQQKFCKTIQESLLTFQQKLGDILSWFCHSISQHCSLKQWLRSKKQIELGINGFIFFPSWNEKLTNFLNFFHRNHSSCKKNEEIHAVYAHLVHTRKSKMYIDFWFKCFV